VLSRWSARKEADASMNIDTVISEVRELPPTPQILPRLQKILRDPESGLDDVVDLVRVDAALTAQIVRLSNSGFYGNASPSSNINDAINRVGFQEVYKLVSLVTSNQLLGVAAPVYHMQRGELFERSVGAAMIMDAMARRGRLDKDLAYTAGLLHGLGKIIINAYCLERGLEIYSDTDDTDDIDPQMERMVLGFTHAEVAGTVLAKWGFPPDVTEPIEYYPEPLEAPEHVRNACLLHLAIWIAYARFLEDNRPLQPPPPEEPIIEASGLPLDEIQDCLDETREDVQKLQKIFR
jgi:HD-like signal output (HDOD) protein